MDRSLPPGLDARGFLVADAVRAGMTPARLRSPRLAVPHFGVRSIAQPESLLERAAAFAPLLQPWQSIGGVMALAVLGLPVPWRLRDSLGVDVVAPKGRGTPDRPGIRVRRVSDSALDTWELEGVRVVAPALAWALLAPTCTEHELVVLGDAIVSDAEHYPDRRAPGPLATIEELRAVVDRWAGRPGAARLRAALPRVRLGVESPRESDMRLFIVDAGMPEPEVQASVHDPETGRLLGRADLLHRDARVVEEYEGKGHRSKEQWDRDIQKYRDFERIGLHVVRATNRDFVPTPDVWLSDLAAVLRDRTA
ncbi:hypothetical protein [Agrococcus sp. Marseille-Q4369]|uniref:hypothetical protein n=1 Tax=Agrococcus sp. Marseille-Q4369 TaxID=2810513 RepID=UPI001B8C9B5F|nr:hypothetical protein [Agrococcus sp. Marseille-Q4369]QUW18593.1 hypothetical protein JSQ78_12480 [Agrococcus sp. Marseille-Q4369]